VVSFGVTWFGFAWLEFDFSFFSSPLVRRPRAWLWNDEDGPRRKDYLNCLGHYDVYNALNKALQVRTCDG
jgi:hypothetical protein